MSVPVFTPNAASGFDAHAQWRTSIDQLCVAVVRAAGQGATVRYQGGAVANAHACGRARLVGLDIEGPRGCVYLHISISHRGSADVLDETDLPQLDLGHVDRDREIEFWLPREHDAICLLATLLDALGQGASVVFGSSFGPSTSAR
ncbi:TPA: hypothetical protein ACUNF5_002759 [Burkholderia orbicola]|nr:hypothetical protein DF039_30415 [Burkholderia cenocepacia]